MDGLTLLHRARDAGLAVAAEGDKLDIRGPRKAEPVARLLLDRKPEVMAALSETYDWRARHREALAHWGALHSPEEAARIAWGELEDRWHKLHGQRTPPHLCAGCGEPIADREALALADRNRVHLDTLDCLIAYGKQWRGEATAALVAMGLEPPREKEEEKSEE